MVRPKSLRQHSKVLSDKKAAQEDQAGRGQQSWLEMAGNILKGLHWVYFLTEAVQLASLFLPSCISFLKNYIQSVLCVCIFYIHGF